MTEVRTQVGDPDTDGPRREGGGVRVVALTDALVPPTDSQPEFHHQR